MIIKTFNLDDLFTLPYMGRCKKYKEATDYHEFDSCSAKDDETGMTKFYGCTGCAFKQGER